MLHKTDLFGEIVNENSTNSENFFDTVPCWHGVADPGLPDGGINL